MVAEIAVVVDEDKSVDVLIQDHLGNPDAIYVVKVKDVEWIDEVIGEVEVQVFLFVPVPELAPA